ncbi:protein-tyrosine phosphatase-like protein [Haematococcus lacustris]
MGDHNLQRPNLRTLDLKALPKDDGPPSETQLRRQKYQFFEKQCSEVASGLFLSGDWVARNRELLHNHGITHVVNCVGFVCQEYFKGELDYKTYFLQDTPAEDILCVLYDVFEYIDTALSSGGRVLVHCSQGVSRSASLVIAYLMWREKASYDDIFARVKAIRGVANPNIGFTCQLLQWQKRRNAPPARTRMYRIASHSQHAPLLLVPRTVTPPKKYATHTWRELDPRGAFIIQARRPHCGHSWQGPQMLDLNVAQGQLDSLQRFASPQLSGCLATLPC